MWERGLKQKFSVDNPHIFLSLPMWERGLKLVVLTIIRINL